MKTLKIIGKYFGFAAMMVGILAFCAADSEVSIGGTLLIALVAVVGTFGGGWLVNKMDPNTFHESDID